MPSKLKIEQVLGVLSIPVIYLGLRIAELEFRRTGVTPRWGFRLMRFAYAPLNGRFYQRWARSIESRETRSAKRGQDAVGLGQTEAVFSAEEQSLIMGLKGERDECIEALRRDGFYIFNTMMPEAMVRSIRDHGLKAPVTVNSDNKKKIVLDRWPGPEKSEHRRYDLDETDVVRIPEVQDLLTTEFWSDLAREYFRVDVVFQDLLAMWFSTSQGGGSASSAAQEFHFDLDRPRFVKVFFALTDIGNNNGPHVVVRTSHVHKPRRFRRPRRFADQEVENQWDKEVTSITGSAGTIFVVDTSALHKGAELKEGWRLLLQFEYSTSLFGAEYSTITRESLRRGLANQVDFDRDTYRRFSSPSDPMSPCR